MVQVAPLSGGGRGLKRDGYELVNAPTESLLSPEGGVD